MRVFAGIGFTAMLLLGNFHPVAAQGCGPQPETALAESLLAQFPAPVPAGATLAATSTLGASGGAIEAFLSAFMSWPFIASRQSNPALFAGPQPPAGIAHDPGRGAGFAMAQAQWSSGAATYEARGGVFVSPLLLDLDGDGVPDVTGGDPTPHGGLRAGASLALFDMDGDSYPDITEWVGTSDALLVAPENPASITAGPAGYAWSGPIGIRDLFGTGEGYPDGFAKLMHRFDANLDGMISGAELSGLYAWRDLNGNGVPDAGELNPLTSLGITALVPPGSGTCAGSFTDAAGQHALWDWWPSYLSVNRVQAGTTAPSRYSFTPSPDSLPQIPVSAIAVSPAGLVGAAALAAAGLNLQAARLLGVSQDGRTVMLEDPESDPVQLDAGRAVRLWSFDVTALLGGSVTPRAVRVTARNVSQFVFEPSGTALVATDEGSRLLRYDPATGRSSLLVAPAPGVAEFRCGAYAKAGSAGTWVSGSFLDANGIAGPARLAHVDDALGAIVGDLDLRAARTMAAAYGTVSLDAPASGSLLHLVTRTTTGFTRLLACDGSSIALEDSGSIAPAGLAACGNRVLYFMGAGGTTNVEPRVYDDSAHVMMSLGAPGAYAYPYLADGGARAIVTRFDWPNSRMTLFSTAVPAAGGVSLSALVTTPIGAVRVSGDGRVVAILSGEGLRIVTQGVLAVPPTAAAQALSSLATRPNPFRQATSISFSLAGARHVRIELFTAAGRRIATLLDANRPAGAVSAEWNGRDSRGRPVPPGVYLVRVDCGTERRQTKLALLR